MSRLLAMLVLVCGTAAAASLQAEPARADDPRRGWHFYDDPAKPAPAGSRTIEKGADPEREIRRYKALQKALEESRIVAIMAPTIGNVRAYLELEASVLRGASRFADVARRVAWMSPELDPNAQTRPSATFAVDVFERQKMAQQRTQLAALAREHIMLFFFRGDCPYCHAFAPVLKAFEQRHGLRVTAVSTDGGTLPEFTRPRVDHGIAQVLKVKQVPALFLAHPASGRIVPIGFGVLSESELLERIVTTAAQQPTNTLAVPSR